MSIREDHNRFRHIVKGRIKENLRKFVSEGEMIGKREKDFVKIPIPRIDIPTFRYGPKEKGGVGRGEGDSGEAVDGQSGQEKAGDQPGEHQIEVDVSLEELADILGEALELPNIQPKGNKQINTQGMKVKGMAPVGPASLRHFKSSYKKALMRSIASGTYDPNDPLVVPIRRDMRYRSVGPVQKPHTQAVVIYMMDVSGSMGDEQKEIVRLESFWINSWLKKHYKGLETRFIIHDAAAKEVDEETFFKTSESGGTLISSAYKLCQKIIEEDYPPSEWNIYPFHFSDGDNWSSEDTKLCLQMLNDFFIPRVNMFGYGQVESQYGSGQFSKDLEKELSNQKKLIVSKIANRDGILDSIKDFLGKGH